MKINKDTWHYETFRWWERNSFSEFASARRWRHTAPPISLCRYFWIVMLYVPLMWLLRGKSAVALWVVAAFGLLSVMAKGIAAEQGISFWLAFLQVAGVVTAIIVGGLLLLFIAAAISTSWRKLDEGNPSLASEYISAKKRKVCPIIEFEEEDE